MTKKLKYTLIAVCCFLLLIVTPTLAWYSEEIHKFVSVQYHVGSEPIYSLSFGSTVLDDDEKNLIPTMPSATPTDQYSSAPTATALSANDWILNSFGQTQTIADRNNANAVVLSGSHSDSGLSSVGKETGTDTKKIIGVRMIITPRDASKAEDVAAAELAEKIVRYAAFYSTGVGGGDTVIGNNNYHYGSGRYVAVGKEGCFDYVEGETINYKVVFWLDSMSEPLPNRGVFDVNCKFDYYDNYVHDFTYSTTDSGVHLNVGGFDGGTCPSYAYFPEAIYYSSSLAYSNITGFTNNSAFSAKKNLTAIIIPDSVTRIPSSYFHDNDSVEYVIIGNGVNEIDYKAFYSCAKLKRVIFRNPYGWVQGSSFENGKQLNLMDVENNADLIGSSSGNSGTSSSSTWRRKTNWAPTNEDVVTAVTAPTNASIPLKDVESIANAKFSYTGTTPFGTVKCPITALSWKNAAPTTIGTFKVKGTVTPPIGYTLASGITTAVEFNVTTTTTTLLNTVNLIHSITYGDAYTLPTEIGCYYNGGSVDIPVTWYNGAEIEANIVTDMSGFAPGAYTLTGVLACPAAYVLPNAEFRASAIITVHTKAALGEWTYTTSPAAYNSSWTASTNFNASGVTTSDVDLFTNSSYSITATALSGMVKTDLSTARTKGFIAINGNTAEAIRVIVPVGFVGTLIVDFAPLAENGNAELTFNSIAKAASSTATTGTDGGIYNNTATTEAWQISGGGTYYLGTTAQSETAYISRISLSGYIDVSKIITSITAPQSNPTIYLKDLSELQSLSVGYKGTTGAIGGASSGEQVSLNTTSIAWVDNAPTAVGTYAATATLTAPEGYVFNTGLETTASFNIDVTYVLIDPNNLSTPTAVNLPFVDKESISSVTDLTSTATADDGVQFEFTLTEPRFTSSSINAPGNYDAVATATLSATELLYYTFSADNKISLSAYAVPFTVTLNAIEIDSIEDMPIRQTLALGETFSGLPITVVGVCSNGTTDTADDESVTVYLTWQEDENTITSVTKNVPGIYTYSPLLDYPTGCSISNAARDSIMAELTYYTTATDKAADITKTLAVGETYSLPEAMPIYYGASGDYIEIPVTWRNSQNVELSSNVINTESASSNTYTATYDTTAIFTNEENYTITATVTIEATSGVYWEWVMPDFGTAWATGVSGNITSNVTLAPTVGSSAQVAVTAIATKCQVDSESGTHPHTYSFIKVNRNASDAIKIDLPLNFNGTVTIYAMPYKSTDSARVLTFNGATRTTASGAYTGTSSSATTINNSSFNYISSELVWSNVDAATAGTTLYVSNSNAGNTYISRIVINGSAGAATLISSVNAPTELTMPYISRDNTSVLNALISGLTVSGTDVSSAAVSGIAASSIVWKEGTSFAVGNGNTANNINTAQITFTAPSGYCFNDDATTAVYDVAISLTNTEVTEISLPTGLSIAYSDIENVTATHGEATLTLSGGGTITKVVTASGWALLPTSVGLCDAAYTLTLDDGYVFASSVACSNGTIELALNGLSGSGTFKVKVYETITSLENITANIALGETYTFTMVNAKNANGDVVTTLSAVWKNSSNEVVTAFTPSAVGTTVFNGNVSGTDLYRLAEGIGAVTATINVTANLQDVIYNFATTEAELLTTVNLPETISVGYSGGTVDVPVTWTNGATVVDTSTVGMKNYVGTLGAVENYNAPDSATITAAVQVYAVLELPTLETVEVTYGTTPQLPTSVTGTATKYQGQTISYTFETVTWKKSGTSIASTTVDTLTSLGAVIYNGSVTETGNYRASNTATAEYLVKANIASVQSFDNVELQLDDETGYTLPSEITVHYGSGDNAKTAFCGVVWKLNGADVASNTVDTSVAGEFSYVGYVILTGTNFKNDSNITATVNVTVVGGSVINVTEGWQYGTSTSYNWTENDTSATTLQFDSNRVAATAHGVSITANADCMVDGHNDTKQFIKLADNKSGAAVSIVIPSSMTNVTIEISACTYSPKAANYSLSGGSLASAVAKALTDSNGNASTTANGDDTMVNPTVATLTVTGLTSGTYSLTRTSGASVYITSIMITATVTTGALPRMSELTMPSGLRIAFNERTNVAALNANVTATAATDSTLTLTMPIEIIDWTDGTPQETGNKNVTASVLPAEGYAFADGTVEAKTLTVSVEVYNVELGALTLPTDLTIPLASVGDLSKLSGSKTVTATPDGYSQQSMNVSFDGEGAGWTETPTAVGTTNELKGYISAPTGYVFNGGTSRQLVTLNVATTNLTAISTVVTTNDTIPYIDKTDINNISATATVTFPNGITKTATVSSIAWEDENNLKVGNNNATCTVTLNENGYVFENGTNTTSANLSVTLTAVQVADPVLSSASLSLLYINKGTVDGLGVRYTVSGVDGTLGATDIHWKTATPTTIGDAIAEGTVTLPIGYVFADGENYKTVEFTVELQKSPITSISPSTHTDSVVQGATYDMTSLPKTVIATYDTNKKVSLNLTWSPSTVNTSTLGPQTLTGEVECGDFYSNPDSLAVSATITVTQQYTITSVTQPSGVTINSGSSTTLPSTAKGNYSGGTHDFTITWNSSTVPDNRVVSPTATTTYTGTIATEGSYIVPSNLSNISITVTIGSGYTERVRYSGDKNGNGTGTFTLSYAVDSKNYSISIVVSGGSSNSTSRTFTEPGTSTTVTYTKGRSFNTTGWNVTVPTSMRIRVYLYCSKDKTISSFNNTNVTFETVGVYVQEFVVSNGQFTMKKVSGGNIVVYAVAFMS